MRLDLYILQKYSLKSRSFAENIIKKGKVRVNSVIYTKPSLDVTDSDIIDIDIENEFESLGGDKLQKALETFKISLQNKECVDIGASNGGFTDVMLRNGAKSVVAVDVAECAFQDKLKNDKRVIIVDKTNARTITPQMVFGKKDFMSIDVSFISLKLVLDACFSLLKDDGEAVILIKPQFEIGKLSGKSGIVKDVKERTNVINSILLYAKNIGFSCVNITTVPQNFKNKNIEYLCHFKKIAEKSIQNVNIDFVKSL